MRKLILVLLNAVIVAITVKAQVLRIDPAVRRGTLPNGFTYYIRHNEEPKDRVVMYLVNKVGSVLEDNDQRGLAHFMEHMEFNGTANFPHNALIDYLQKAGVRFGADINAYTNFDETVYQLPLPSDKPGLVDTGLMIMRDWAQNAMLDSGEINKERGVVLEEKRLGKGAAERMQRLYWPVLLNNSRYAVRMPIGNDTVLNGFKRPVIASFYNDWYRPDLQALIVVGDVNVNTIEQDIKRMFAGLKKPSHEKARIKYQVPLDGKNRFVAVTDKEMTVAAADIIFKHPEQPLKTETDYRKYLIKNLYNQMLAKRIDQLSRQATPPFLQGGASIGGFIGGLSMFDVSVVAKPGELENGVKAVWREIERVKQFGFTQGELDRTKAAYLNNVESQWKEKAKTNSESFVREYQNYFLKDIAAPGIDKERELVKTFLPAIFLADVNALSAANITCHDRTILLLAPDKEKEVLPSEVVFTSWINTVQAEKLTPYQDDISNKLLLAQQPVLGKIVEEQKDSATGTYSYLLSNHVRVILKPTDFKNDEIIFTGIKPGGTSTATDAAYESAALSADLVNSSGAGNYNETELENYLADKQTNVIPFMQPESEGVNGNTTPKNLENALALTYAYITEPRKDKEIFDGIVTKSIAALANRSSDPNSLFSDSVRAILYNKNVRKAGPSLEKIKQLNLDTAITFYENRFRNVNGMTFVFVGAIDTTTIKPLLEKYLGGLPSHENIEDAKDLGIHIREGIVNKNVYKGTEPRSTVLLVYSGLMEYNPQNVVRLDALKETLEIRLLERLREEESGVYSPGVFVSSSKYPQGRYSFVVQFGCAPQNADKLIASVQDEIDKLKQSGPLPQNLEKWRAEDRNSRETALKTNGFWLRYLSGQVENKESISKLNDYTKIRDKISVADIQNAAMTYLSGLNYIRLVLLPESKLTSR
ncbi:M16 family metallopeptidase [Mucilaginibacter ginsenosidivorans]|uniref:Insulinase family protein n=1 Tax=Mucilaginibacter ginsenosidivorans TaxID=398053 RepID=A0A5B8UU63_9SPHI|nr:M16 family metallopeptidase [Mucilaginibacter ginsenosidivorans]QEC62439.1 insulinase family protein [Mucilaginibacter ginsenosidivorans]